MLKTCFFWTFEFFTFEVLATRLAVFICIILVKGRRFMKWFPSPRRKTEYWQRYYKCACAKNEKPNPPCTYPSWVFWYQCGFWKFNDKNLDVCVRKTKVANLTLLHAVIERADQPAHPRSLIRAFLVPFRDITLLNI